MDLNEQKAIARKAAFARRKVAFNKLTATPATKLAEVLRRYAGKTLAAYMPIRTEISPLIEMQAHDGVVCVPVIQDNGEALRFARWSSNSTMVDGPFGALVPEPQEYITPEVLIVPLVSFDNSGNRLGYGGGFYDRTLEGLRKLGDVVAIGYAFEAQCAEDLPLEPTDQPLNFIVTETKIRSF